MDSTQYIGLKVSVARLTADQGRKVSPWSQLFRCVAFCYIPLSQSLCFEGLITPSPVSLPVCVCVCVCVCQVRRGQSREVTTSCIPSCYQPPFLCSARPSPRGQIVATVKSVSCASAKYLVRNSVPSVTLFSVLDFCPCSALRPLLLTLWTRSPRLLLELCHGPSLLDCSPRPISYFHRALINFPGLNSSPCLLPVSASGFPVSLGRNSTIWPGV